MRYRNLATIGLGLFALTAFATDAFASDLDRPIRRARAGESHYRHPEYFATFGAGAFDPSNQPGSGLYMSGSFGSVLAKQVDLGLQLSWYHRSTNGGEFVSYGQLPDGTNVQTTISTQEVDSDLIPFMGIMRVKFPVSPGIAPYVGGGIGWEWLTVEGYDGQGYYFYNDYDGFGAQVFGGMSLEMSRQASVYGEAIYNFSTLEAEFYDPYYSTVVTEKTDFDGLGIHGGLRFRF